MNVIDAAVLLIGGLFGFYGLTSAIEYGIVFKLLASDKSVKHMFTPLWEVTNVFLVFGFTALAILFNGALGRLSHLLLPTLVTGIVAMVVRACSVLGMFYIKADAEPPLWLVWLFGLSTIATPLIFTSAGVYLLSGSYFWHSLVGTILMVSAFTGFSAGGLLIIDRRQNRLRQLPGQLVFCVWLLMVGCILPLTVLHTTTYLSEKPLSFVVGLAALGLTVGLAGYIKPILLKSWHIVGFFLVVLPALMAWALRPYLLAGQITLADAYGASSYGRAVVIGLGILLPLIILGLWLFSKLLSQPPDASK